MIRTTVLFASIFVAASAFHVAPDVEVMAYTDRDCMGPAVAVVNTTFNTCTALQGVGMVQVNTPTAPKATCAFLTGFMDRNCTVSTNSRTALNSKCGSCQGTTYEDQSIFAYGVTCPSSISATSATLATFCSGDECQGCTNTEIHEKQCTFVGGIGYVKLDHVGPCRPVGYTFYGDADFGNCGKDSFNSLPYEIPSGSCNNGLRVTLLN